MSLLKRYFDNEMEILAILGWVIPLIGGILTLILELFVYDDEHPVVIGISILLISVGIILLSVYVIIERKRKEVKRRKSNIETQEINS